MQDLVFYKIGKLIYRLRWFIIFFWLIMLLACIPFLPHIIAPFKTTGFIDENSDSVKTERFLDKELGYIDYNKFMVLYHSKDLSATGDAFNKKIRYSLKNLKNFSQKHTIILPSDNKKQIAKDKHTAYAVILIKGQKKISSDQLAELKSLIKKPANMDMQIGGSAIFEEAVNIQTQRDIYAADFIATPAALITLILVFGSVVAALVPLVLGGGCALLILTALYFLGHIFTLSIFTLNIALLLGLCLSLDYSLFIISRFREELQKTDDIIKAIAVTQATAGHAILFSGLAVFASLSALLLFPVNILFSIGVGGLMAVFVSVLIALVLLPAVLSVFKTRINWLSLPSWKGNDGRKFWHWLAEKVVHRPWRFFFPILAVLLFLAFPIVYAKFGVSDFRIFPAKSEHRLFFDIYAKKFNEQDLSPILVVVKSKDTPILSKNNLNKLYDLVEKIQKNPLVKEVNSIVNVNSRLMKSQYYALYKTSKSMLDKGISDLLETTTRQYFTVITVISKYKANAPETQDLVDDLKNMPAPKGTSLHLTGTPIINMDLLASISRVLPYALLSIMVVTYIILLFLLRSLVLPLKAIIMNILSLSACYGALVLVFQEGYLHELLNFSPQGMLDISLLVIIFCALFGFSMDYEVFLLSRIREDYEICEDNRKSIVFGIEKSSRIITSAALIVIVLCFSFLVADVLMVKAFGLGIAVAIFVDAFLIRTIFIPATMSILGSWNWYLPKWLDKILPRL